MKNEVVVFRKEVKEGKSLLQNLGEYESSIKGYSIVNII